MDDFKDYGFGNYDTEDFDFNPLYPMDLGLIERPDPRHFTMADFEKSQARIHIADLPAELHVMILERLEARDLAMISCTSRQFHSIVEKWQPKLVENIYSQQRQRLQQVIKARNYNFSWKPTNLDDPGQHLLDCLIDFDSTYHIYEKTKHGVDLIVKFMCYFMKACRFDADSTWEDAESARTKKGPLSEHEQFLILLNYDMMIYREYTLHIIVYALACDLIRYQLLLDDCWTSKPFGLQIENCPADIVVMAWEHRLNFCPSWTKHFNELFAQVKAKRPFKHRNSPAPLSCPVLISNGCAPFNALPATSTAFMRLRFGGICTDMDYVSSDPRLLKKLPKYDFQCSQLQQAALMESTTVWHRAVLDSYYMRRIEMLKSLERRLRPLLFALEGEWHFGIVDLGLIEDFRRNHEGVEYVENELWRFGVDIVEFVTSMLKVEGQLELANALASRRMLRPLGNGTCYPMVL